MYRYDGPTIPEKGLYAGKLYTADECAEIKRKNCMTHGQRQHAVSENHAADRLAACMIVGFFTLLMLAMSIVENLTLGF